MMDAIGGFWVAIASPLDGQGDLDLELFTRHVLWLLDQGCDGVVPFGTSGEGTSFSANEKLAAMEALLTAGVSPDRILLGASFPAVGDTVALVRSALRLGLGQVLLLPPYFYRDVTPQGIEDAFAAVIDGVSDDRLRATLYHIPQVSGVSVPAPVAARLRKRYGRIVAGVKDSSGQFADFLAFRAAAPELPIVVGNEADIGRALAQGGSGTISGLGNLVPEMVRAMFTDPAAAGPMRQAIELMANPFVPTLKASIAASAGQPAWARVRAPLRAADLSVGERIVSGLRDLQARSAA